LFFYLKQNIIFGFKITITLKKIILLYCFTTLYCFAQNNTNPCETLLKINSLIQNYHYKPKAVDDSLSVYVFNTFLNNLDEEHRLFIELEVTELQKYRYSIDDNIKNNNCSFLHDFFVAYSKTVIRYRDIITSLKTDNFPLTSSEKVLFSKKAFPFAKDENELKHLYQKRILFNILRDVAELSTNKDSLIANFSILAANSKAAIFDKYECKAESYQLTEKEFQGVFYTAFCSYFDPHTEYFSENEKASFYSTVSSDNLTFGFYVSMTEKDEMTVDEVIPGSSAYYTEKIDKGDQILKIKHEGEEYQIACASMKKIDEIISSNQYKTADFTFRKKSGEIYCVRLEKKIMKDYQNNVYSFILQKDTHTFGYLKIPSFYSTFENGKSNVSNDVLKEVYKLQENGIEGLIIDIENNGGGSMQEAIQLSSLFIDSGPLAIMNNNKNKKEVLKDDNRGTIYNGPIVLLINGFSASASEFFANAMQDYNRAILVGSQSLGKATMQRIFPLTNNNDEFLKLTLETFYRITGQSNQYTGITPDVVIPTLFDQQMPRENNYKTALPNDVIKTKVKFNRLPNLVYSKAINASKNRIASSVISKEITALNAKINPIYEADLPPVKLQLDEVYHNVTQMNSLWKTIQTETEKEYPLSIVQNTIDETTPSNDEFIKSYTGERMKEMKQNFHLWEAVNILDDLQNIKPE
jgi:carboxyl-terminal processing protease